MNKASAYMFHFFVSYPLALCLCPVFFPLSLHAKIKK